MMRVCLLHQLAELMPNQKYATSFIIHIMMNLPIEEGDEDDENNKSSNEVEYVKEEPYTQKIIKICVRVCERFGNRKVHNEKIV
jgi:hypothetical protein